MASTAGSAKPGTAAGRMKNVLAQLLDELLLEQAVQVVRQGRGGDVQLLLNLTRHHALRVGREQEADDLQPHLMAESGEPGKVLKAHAAHPPRRRIVHDAAQRRRVASIDVAPEEFCQRGGIIQPVRAEPGQFLRQCHPVEPQRRDLHRHDLHQRATKALPVVWARVSHRGLAAQPAAGIHRSSRWRISTCT